MKTRIVSGVVGAVILILVLISDRIFLNIGVALVASVAIIEMFRAVGISKYKSLNILGVVMSFAFTYAQALDNYIIMPLLYIFVVVLFVLYMCHIEGIQFKDISKAFLSAVFVCLFFGHLVFIRKMTNGRCLIWTVFIISFLTDTFAYLVGKFFGRHKLAPNLSPKKTIEGSLGGFFGAVAGMVVYCLILKNMSYEPNFVNAIIISVICSVVSQFGDLAASAVKRQYKIKDYGRIMPGHGGIMDRFDGVIFTAPVVFYLLSLFPIL